jgi:hypothetical protein
VKRSLSFISFFWVFLFLSFFSVSFVSAQTVIAQPKIYSELHPFFPRAKFRFFDSRYQNISEHLFHNKFLPEFSAYLQSRGLRGVTAGFSEKHYAELCKSQLQLYLVQHARFYQEAAVAVLVTDPQAKAAQPSLPSGWLLVNLEGRWFVLDAARFSIVTLEAFSHKDAIAAVQF